MALIWTILSILVFLYLLHELLSLKKKKKLPPGPRGLPVLGHFHLLGENPHQDLSHLARKHGPIMYMRFGFVPTIVVSSPAGAELILKTHDLVFASRPHHEASKYISYEQRGLVFGRYGSHWRNMRKLCTLELLSNLRINQFQAMRKAELGLLITSLKQAAETREVVDLSVSVLGLSSDMFCLMIFGRKYADRDFHEKGFKAVFSETVEIGARFNLGDYFPYIGALDLQGLNRKLKSLSKTFDGFFEKIIDDHLLNKHEKDHTEDFVDVMMAIVESEESEFNIDRRHVKSLLLDMHVAGTDTSATTVEWALSELMKNPSTMKKLQLELESVVGMDHTVDESHLDRLVYLDCIIKETLRLHPAAPLLLPHESTQDCIVDGFHIPKGSRVMVNVWAIGRDPNVWSNPETFSPERFIDSNIELKGKHFQLIPFGSGRRGCPGMQLGLTIVRLVVAQLVHCFDWELPNGMVPYELDMSEQFGLVSGRAMHLEAIPRYRLNK